MRRSGSRLVWSSDAGPVCAACGQPRTSCRCTTPDSEPLPARVVARLRLETSGRSGKEVTVVSGLPRNRDLLRALASELKRTCGSGGTATADGVELQGDKRERLRAVLVAKGWVVKG